jgi:hypothetical protein
MKRYLPFVIMLSAAVTFFLMGLVLATQRPAHIQDEGAAPPA